MITPDKLDNAIILKFFNKEEYARKFVNGELFTSKPQRFRGIGSEGREDNNEGKIKIPGKYIELYVTNVNVEKPNKTDRINGLLNMILNASSYANTPIWCSTLVYEGNGITKIGDKLVFDEDVKRIPKIFGNYVVVMYFTKFIKIMSEYFGERLWAKEIEYADSIEIAHNIQKYMDDQLNIVFTKDKEYDYQHEYRMILINETIDTDTKSYKGPKLSIDKKDCMIGYADKLLNNGITIIDDINKASLVR